MQNTPLPRLLIALPNERIPGFASLLQHGILLNMYQPTPLLPLLLSLPGFTAEYIEKTVQTIFINGVAADRLDQLLHAGNTIALSAAMPGLAGAIFRRQGLHASLRTQPQTLAPSSPSASGTLTLKLFNSIATDRVQDLLTQGICVTGKSIHDFASRQPHLFQPPTALTLAGQALGYAALLEALAEYPALIVQGSLVSQNN